MADAMLIGVVKAWLADRGFGFIAPDGGGKDAYFNRADLPPDQICDPRVGQRVMFRSRVFEDGKHRAFRVRPMD